MSAPARVSAVADLGESVVDTIAEVIGSGTDLARDVADELLQSAAGVLGARHRRRSSPVGKLLAVFAAVVAGAVLFGVVRRMRSRRATQIEVATTDRRVSPPSSNGTQDRVATPVG